MIRIIIQLPISYVHINPHKFLATTNYHPLIIIIKTYIHTYIHTGDLEVHTNIHTYISLSYLDIDLLALRNNPT